MSRLKSLHSQSQSLSRRSFSLLPDKALNGSVWVRSYWRISPNFARILKRWTESSLNCHIRHRGLLKVTFSDFHVLQARSNHYIGELLKPEETSRLDKAEFSQPLCTAIQIGLVNLLTSWGVQPIAVVGHSSGEIAAAYASKAITSQAAIMVAYYRGQATKLQTRLGGMAAVGIGRDSVAQYLIDGVVVACENSPSSVTLSGDREQLNEVTRRISAEQPEVFVRHLKVEMAYHSREFSLVQPWPPGTTILTTSSDHMQEIGDDYQALMKGHIHASRPHVPFFSSVTGKVIVDSDSLGPSYWRSNLESPVLFNTATQAIFNEISQNTLFLEIGPHSALAGPLRQIFKASKVTIPPTYVPTLVRDKHCTASLLSAVGQLHMQAVPITFESLTHSRTVLTNLPTYSWQHDTKYWGESRITREWRFRQFPRHELLGSRILEGNELEPTWRNILHLDDVSWLRDHKIVDDIVFPAAGYIAMVGEAVRQLTPTDDVTLRQVIIMTALVLQESKTAELMTSFRPLRLTTALNSAWYEFSISSYNGTTWTKHCIGQVKAGPEQSSPIADVNDLTRKVPASAWYSTMKMVGLNYGPSFQGLADITASPNSKTAIASLADQPSSSEARYLVHPTTIDACLQLFTTAASQGVARHLTKLSVPTNIEELYFRQGSSQMRAVVTAASAAMKATGGNATIMADSTVILHLRGGVFSPLEEDPIEQTDTVAGAQLAWKPDIDFLPATKLMHPLESLREVIMKVERLALLCMLETRHRISSLETNVEHLKKFRSWLDLQANRAERGEYDLIKEAPEYESLNSEKRLEALSAASREVEASVCANVGKILLSLLEQCKAMFKEELDPLEILLKDDGLKNLYKFYEDMWNCRGFFQSLSHAKPNLRILEIGAGTGGTTAGVLADLTLQSGERMYADYSFTDISAGFFAGAKERFKAYQNIHYAVLDISKDPIEQGFEAESYDLILASNVSLQMCHSVFC